MNVFELGAKIGLDTKGFKNGLSEAESKFEKFGGAVKKGFDTLVKTAAAATAAIGAAAIAFTKSAVDTGAQFDSSMSQVAATMGKTVDEIGELRDFAQKMGSETAFSASQAADALNYMALAGYDAATSMDMLPTVLDLAAAGGIELAAASDMVTDASSALGLSIEETKVMVDQMAMASSRTNTSVAQLGEAFLTVGGTAKSLKGGTQELSQVLGLMADNGIKASEAGTHMRNILLAMNPTTDAAVAAWSKLGVTAYDDTGALKDMSVVFGELSAAMSDMSDLEKTETISAMFNKTDLSAVNALLSTDAERWNEVSEAIGNADGAAKKMAETQLDNLTGDITLFKSAWEGLQIAVADKVIPTFRPFVQIISELTSAITRIIKNGGGFSDVFERVAQTVGGLRIRLTQMIRKSLPSVVEGIKGLFDGIKSNVIKLVPKLAESIPQIIDFLVDSFMARQDFIVNLGSTVIETLLSGIKENIPKIADGIKTIIQHMTSFFTNELPVLMQTGVELLTALVNGIAEALPELMPVAVECILTLVDTLTQPDMIVTIIDTALTLILALADGLIAALPVLLEKAPVIIDNLMTAIERIAPKLLETAYKLIMAIVDGLNKNLPKIFEAGKQIISRLILGIVNVSHKVSEKGAELITDFLNGIAGRYQDTFNAGKEIFNKVKEGIKSVIGDAWNWGWDLVYQFTEGIKSNMPSLSNVIGGAQGIAGMIRSFMHFSVPDVGPLADFDEYAPDMMDLFIKGIKDNESKLKNQITDTFDFENMIKAPEISVRTSDGGSNSSYAVANNITINVTSGVISSDYDAHRTAQKISEQLAILQLQQRKAVGI